MSVMNKYRDYFTSEDVMKITGFNKQKLYYFFKTGIISPIKYSNSLFFTFQELLELKIISTLRDFLSLQKLRSAKEYLSTLGLTSDFYDKSLVVYSNSLYLIDDNNIEKNIINLIGKNRGQYVIAILHFNDILREIESIGISENIVNFDRKKRLKKA